jgi:hypothetical protein
MPRLLRFTGAVAVVLAAACSEPTAPARAPEQGPATTISDAAHAGGPSHFYFLPPMVKAPASFSGTFDATLSPSVEVCALSGTACGATVATFTTSGSGSERVRVDGGKYIVNFHSGSFSLDPSQLYRISVFVGAVRLGYADLKVVRSGGDLKNVDPDQYVALKNGATLPIAFRIEQGIAGAVVVSPALDTIAVGQTAQFTASVSDLHGNPLPGAPVTWSSSAPAVATVDANGLATGVAVGTATITATSGGASGSATLVVKTANHPPVAVSDTFQAIGNVTVPVAAPGVLAHDTDPDGDPLSAVAGTFPTAQGGTVTMAADGSLTYLSAPGFTGTDSAAYVVSDGQAADTAQVVFDVPSRVWYVRNTAAAPGDGRDASPFATLAQAEAASSAGETIFVLFGDVSTSGLDAGITLKNGQSLIGQGISSPVVATVNGAPLVLLAAGMAPTIGRASAGTTVQIASNNTIRGVGIASSNGAAVAGSGFGSLAVSEVAIGASGGPGVDLQGGSLAVALSNLSSTGSSGAGLRLAAVTGGFSAVGGSISGSAGAGVDLAGGDADVSFGGSVTAGSGRSVSVTGRSGGTVDLSGTITDNAGGILVQGNTGGTVQLTGSSKSLSTGAADAVTLQGNAGATVRFGGGGLAISTASGAGFRASGGGTVIVTGPHNSIASVGGVALSVSSTTIGAGGLTFESISANGGANGIVLSNTGSVSGLLVTGNGSPASGGVVRGMSGDGIALSGTSSPSLSYIDVESNLGNGIYGSGVNGFSLASSTVAANGDNPAAGEAEIRFDELTGVAGISSTEIAGSIQDNVRVVNTAGSLSLSIVGSVIRDNSAAAGNDGLRVQSSGTASIALAVSGTALRGNHASGITAQTGDAGSLDVQVSGGSLQSNNTGVVLVHGSSGSFTFDVANIGTITGQAASPILVNRLATASAASTFAGRIRGNSVGVAGSTNSGATAGPGIRVVSNGVGGAVTVAVTDNRIREVANRGIEILARDGSSTINATVTGNDIALTSPLSLDAIRMDAGALSTDAVTICASISGNAATTAGGSGIRLRQRFAATTFRLAGYGGSPTADAAVASFLSAGNGGATALVDHGGAGFVGVASCPTP